MTMVLYYILKSGMVIIFFIRFVLTMWNLLYFYMSYFITLIYLCMCVCVFVVCVYCVRTCAYAPGTTYRCRLPPSTMWILDVKLRSSDLVLGVLSW